MSSANTGSTASRSGPSSGPRWRRVALSSGENYVRGIVVLGVAYGLWRGFESLSERVDRAGLQPTIILILTLLILPPILGWLVGRLIYPWMRRFHGLRAVLRGEERFFAELAPDSRRGFPVALVNWPNDRLRSFCVIVATYPDSEANGGFATIFIPGTAEVHRGRCHLVPLDELEIIDWTLTDCLQLYATLGMHGPGHLHRTVPSSTPDDSTHAQTERKETIE